MPVTVKVHALSEEHIGQVVAACSDWEELAQFGPPFWRPRSPAELQRKLSATAGPQPATEYSFVLAAAGGTLVGECSLHSIDWRNRVAQVGICLWRPEDRGSGYGKAGVQQMLRWGFDHLGLARIEAWIIDGNERSLRLFGSLGFIHEAMLRERYLYAGERRDMHVLAQLAAVEDRT